MKSRQLPDDLLVDAAAREFRKLRETLFTILPNDCLLKPRQILAPPMLNISTHGVKLGLITRPDVCAHCPMDTCPWHKKVNFRYLRPFKVYVLAFLMKPLAAVFRG